MRVIDLLNKIANGEEVPEKIKYNETIYYLNDGNYRAYNKYGYPMELMLYNPFFILNDEIEIIEEDKKIEKEDEILTTDDLECPITYNEMKIWKQVIKEHNKINEIIDVLNEMREDK